MLLWLFEGCLCRVSLDIFHTISLWGFFAGEEDSSAAPVEHSFNIFFDFLQMLMLIIIVCSQLLDAVTSNS